MINDIKTNTISEALAKQNLNARNEIKKAETKNKRLINGQRILLNLYDNLIEAIFNNIKIVNEDNKKIGNEDNNDNDNDDDYDSDNDDDYDSDNDDEIAVKEINNNFKKIDETKSFEEQLDILKKYHV